MKAFLLTLLIPIALLANKAQPFAKIKMSEAISIAQTKSSGRLIESSLESENNFLIYSVSFSESDKSVSEIKIDAGTGQILDFKNQSNAEL